METSVFERVGAQPSQGGLKVKKSELSGAESGLVRQFPRIFAKEKAPAGKRRGWKVNRRR